MENPKKDVGRFLVIFVYIIFPIFICGIMGFIEE